MQVNPIEMDRWNSREIAGSKPSLMPHALGIPGSGNLTAIAKASPANIKFMYSMESKKKSNLGKGVAGGFLPCHID